MATDYYEILGVAKSATHDDIKKAYRKLAHKYHPDTGKGDEQKFKQVNEAYNVLGDPNRRASYDRFGEAGANIPHGNVRTGGYENFEDIFSGFGGFTDFGDIFSDIFGANRRGSAGRETRGVNIEIPLTITLQESFEGTEKEVKVNKFEICERCHGNGSEPGKSIITCPRCYGQGQIRTTQQTVFGTVAVSHVCERCSGSGKVPEVPCNVCQGTGRFKKPKTLRVKIPAGIDSGSRMRIMGEGEAGYRGSEPGDLYVAINVEPDPRFRREGDDIYSQIKINFTQATLGHELKIPTLEGNLSLKVPAGTQPGTVFRLRGRGMPRLGKSGHGDHYLTVNVQVPTKLTREQKKVLEELRRLDSE